MNNKYNSKQKVIATVLTASIMVTTVSVCLTSNKQKSIFESALENTTDNLLITSVSQQLNESYQSMAQALAKNDISKVQRIAKNTLNKLDEIQYDFNKSNEEMNKVLVDIDSDELNKIQQGYEKEVQNKFSTVENLLTEISTDEKNIEENVQIYSELFENTDTDFYYNPNPELENAITAEYEDLDISKAKNVSDKVESLALDETAISEADLALTGDVAISDEIKLKAEELKTPYAVYEFVRNNIKYEAYYGSRKGATGTYDSLAGNDTDTASLLIGMLRHLGYNAKYANGVIRMTAEQAMNVTAADNVKSAAQIFANLCKDVKTYTSQGQIKYVEMNRTWVEAYVPYTDYRGAGNASGDSKWIPLDASFKNVELKIEQHSKDESVIASEGFYNTDESHANAKELLSQLPEYEQIESLYGERMPEEFNIYYTKNVPQDIEYLPLSLEYDVISKKTASTNTNLVSSDTIDISVGNDLSCTLRSADVYNKTVTLSYLPASSYDAELIERYGDIRKVPAHLLTLVPVITLDDEVVAKGGEWFDEVTSGTKQRMTLTVNSSGQTMSDSDMVYAGSVYTFVIHYGIISEKELSTAYEKAKEKNLHATTMNTYSSQILGSVLDFAGKYYYSMTDVIDSYYSYYQNVDVSRLLGVSTLGYSLTNETLFGYVTKLIPGSFSIDVVFNTNSIVDRYAENNNSKTFNAIVGYLGSTCEANVWDYLFQEGGISTTKILSRATAEGVPIRYLSSANKAELSELNISSNAANDIANYINAGFIVIIPESEITIGSWCGTGYVTYKLDTGSAVYRISGGLNGGATASPIDLTQSSWLADQLPEEVLDNYVFASIEIVCMFHNFYSMWNMYSLTNAIAKAEACPVLSWDLFNVVCSISYDAQYYYGTLDGIIDYFGYNDEAAGRAIVANALSYLQSFYMDFLMPNKTSILGALAEVSGISDIKDAINNIYYLVTGKLFGTNMYYPDLTLNAQLGLSFAATALDAYTLVKYPYN